MLGRFYGSVGDAWVQALVDMTPDKIATEIPRHQHEFRSRPRVHAIYRVAIPYQRSVIDRFATVAATLRMAINAGLLPWNPDDTDAGIEAAVIRWAAHDNMVNPVVVAFVAFMGDRDEWKGTASELATAFGNDHSGDTLGRWLKVAENVERLRAVGIKLTHTRSRTRDRKRLIQLERINTEHTK
jgi:hypothetical protein